ncbi:acyl-CoA synthetase (AMP-forming)/AMP-acid ligase II [Idiomarina fontislapidosi]|uniref:AMP-dependent synthetase/ligase domain-containing protein n=1 Tax=Idiomarina fontislapidosi TaxID=263723 RepID=A0A432XQY5_9GAMM|nr:AMP-binding protein [Idiomarina fontislapidosi]PYE30731.1 acyl-CoA synthetase (AMP-forming)/AMP-acid ligase II [Idiomarina fontislapidosi]RUO51102.1 hypothetical protein CWE25_11885 [Idiomarina fontislapidosi]
MLFRDALRRHSENTADKNALIFVKGRQCTATFFTFLDLHQLALRVASQLSTYDPKSKKIGIRAANNIEFIAGLLGCLYHGAIAVPIPAEVQGVTSTRGKYIAHAASLDLLLKIGEEESENTLPDNLTVVTIDLSSDTILPFDCLPEIDVDDIAIMQFTSGTGGDPAGVMISHRALVANILLQHEAMGHTQKSNRVYLNWCPFYHDMGLLGGLLNPIFTGVPAVEMTPLDFVKRPLSLLKCVDEYRVTTVGGPTFSYQLISSAVKAARELQSFDLTCWETAYCGAEPVNAAVLEDFAESLKPFGFSEKALLPCYGMAEFTLIISGAPFQTGMNVVEKTINNSRQRIVSCGRVYGDTRIKVLSESGDELKDEEIGEIHISGTSLMDGYWQNDALVKKFEHTDDEGESLFATGDLGFISDGELFLTGRRKHLIKINGVSVFPHLVIADIASSVSALDPLKGIILQLDPKSAKLYVFQELKQGIKLTQEAIEQVSEAGVNAAKKHTGSSDIELFVVKRGFLPRTSSGKLIARNTSEFVVSLRNRLKTKSVA